MRVSNSKKEAPDRIVPNLERSRNKQRRSMPQIMGEDHDEFIRYLSDEHEIGYVREEIDAGTLVPTQNQFNFEKVDKLVRDKSKLLKLPILTTRDKYVVDGHHRWLANYEAGNVQPVLTFDVEIDRFLKVAIAFEKTVKRGLHENQQMPEKQDFHTLMEKLRTKEDSKKDNKKKDGDKKSSDSKSNNKIVINPTDDEYDANNGS